MAEAGKKKRAIPKGRHPSQFKRERQNVKRQARNISLKSALRTAIKNVRQAVSQKKKDKAQELLKAASKALQKAASKGIIHARNAARHISRLSTSVHSLS